MFAMPRADLAHPRADLAHAQSGSGACWRYHSAPCSCLRLGMIPRQKTKSRKVKNRKVHITQRLQKLPFFIAYLQAIYSQLLVHMALPGRSRTRYRWRLTGKIGGGGTSGDARCSTSSARAPHPQSPGGLRRAWRRSPPEKGLPTLRRAYSSRTDLVSVAERGLLLEAPGGGHAGYDSGEVLAGNELIAPPPGNESPRGN